jgi:hypothetical protein
MDLELVMSHRLISKGICGKLRKSFDEFARERRAAARPPARVVALQTDRIANIIIQAYVLYVFREPTSYNTLLAANRRAVYDAGW